MPTQLASCHDRKVLSSQTIKIYFNKCRLRVKNKCCILNINFTTGQQLAIGRLISFSIRTREILIIQTCFHLRERRNCLFECICFFL